MGYINVDQMLREITHEQFVERHAYEDLVANGITAEELEEDKPPARVLTLVPKDTQPKPPQSLAYQEAIFDLWIQANNQIWEKQGGRQR